MMKGFAFTIIPWVVGKQWPSLPDLAQAALNAEHATFSMASELQIMAMLAINAGTGGDAEWKHAVAKTKQAMPPCHALPIRVSTPFRLKAIPHGWRVP